MRASVGDEIIIDAMVLGHPRREGEVLEVRTEGDVEHYVVRWDDGHESIFYPGAEAHVVRLAQR
jgi:hypothetical protein